MRVYLVVFSDGKTRVHYRSKAKNEHEAYKKARSRFYTEFEVSGTPYHYVTRITKKTDFSKFRDFAYRNIIM